MRPIGGELVTTITNSQLLRDSFSLYQQPPIWEPPSHYSMAVLVSRSDHWSTLLHFTSLSWVLSCLQLSLSWAHIWTDPMSVAGEMTGIAQHYYNNQKISLCQTIIVKMRTSLRSCFFQFSVTAGRERYFHKRYVQNSWSLSVAKSLDHCTVDDQGVIADFGCRRIFSFVFGRLTPVLLWSALVKFYPNLM